MNIKREPASDNEDTEEITTARRTKRPKKCIDWSFLKSSRKKRKPDESTNDEISINLRQETVKTIVKLEQKKLSDDFQNGEGWDSGVQDANFNIGSSNLPTEGHYEFQRMDELEEDRSSESTLSANSDNDCCSSTQEDSGVIQDHTYAASPPKKKKKRQFVPKKKIVKVEKAPRPTVDVATLAVYRALIDHTYSSITPSSLIDAVMLKHEYLCSIEFQEDFGVNTDYEQEQPYSGSNRKYESDSQLSSRSRSRSGAVCEKACCMLQERKPIKNESPSKKRKKRPGDFSEIVPVEGLAENPKYRRKNESSPKRSPKNKLKSRGSSPVTPKVSTKKPGKLRTPKKKEKERNISPLKKLEMEDKLDSSSLSSRPEESTKKSKRRRRRNQTGWPTRYKAQLNKRKSSVDSTETKKPRSRSPKKGAKIRRKVSSSTDTGPEEPSWKNIKVEKNEGDPLKTFGSVNVSIEEAVKRRRQTLNESKKVTLPAPPNRKVRERRKVKSMYQRSEDESSQPNEHEKVGSKRRGRKPKSSFKTNLASCIKVERQSSDESDATDSDRKTESINDSSAPQLRRSRRKRAISNRVSESLEVSRRKASLSKNEGSENENQDDGVPEDDLPASSVNKSSSDVAVQRGKVDSDEVVTRNDENGSNFHSTPTQVPATSPEKTVEISNISEASRAAPSTKQSMASPSCTKAGMGHSASSASPSARKSASTTQRKTKDRISSSVRRSASPRKPAESISRRSKKADTSPLRTTKTELNSRSSSTSKATSEKSGSAISRRSKFAASDQSLPVSESKKTVDNTSKSRTQSDSKNRPTSPSKTTLKTETENTENVALSGTDVANSDAHEGSLVPNPKARMSLRKRVRLQVASFFKPRCSSKSKSSQSQPPKQVKVKEEVVGGDCELSSSNTSVPTDSQGDPKLQPTAVPTKSKRRRKKLLWGHRKPRSKEESSVKFSPVKAESYKKNTDSSTKNCPDGKKDKIIKKPTEVDDEERRAELGLAIIKVETMESDFLHEGSFLDESEEPAPDKEVIDGSTVSNSMLTECCDGRSETLPMNSGENDPNFKACSQKNELKDLACTEEFSSGHDSSDGVDEYSRGGNMMEPEVVYPPLENLDYTGWKNTKTIYTTDVSDSELEDECSVSEALGTSRDASSSECGEPKSRLRSSSPSESEAPQLMSKVKEEIITSVPREDVETIPLTRREEDSKTDEVIHSGGEEETIRTICREQSETVTAIQSEEERGTIRSICREQSETVTAIQSEEERDTIRSICREQMKKTFAAFPIGEEKENISSIVSKEEEPIRSTCTRKERHRLEETGSITSISRQDDEEAIRLVGGGDVRSIMSIPKEETDELTHRREETVKLIGRGPEVYTTMVVPSEEREAISPILKERETVRSIDIGEENDITPAKSPRDEGKETITSVSREEEKRDAMSNHVHVIVHPSRDTICQPEEKTEDILKPDRIISSQPTYENEKNSSCSSADRVELEDDPTSSMLSVKVDLINWNARIKHRRDKLRKLRLRRFRQRLKRRRRAKRKFLMRKGSYPKAASLMDPAVKRFDLDLSSRSSEEVGYESPQSSLSPSEDNSSECEDDLLFERPDSHNRVVDLTKAHEDSIKTVTEKSLRFFKVVPSILRKRPPVVPNRVCPVVTGSIEEKIEKLLVRQNAESEERPPPVMNIKEESPVCPQPCVTPMREEKRVDVVFTALSETNPPQSDAAPVVKVRAIDEDLPSPLMKTIDAEEMQNQELREGLVCEDLPEREPPQSCAVPVIRHALDKGHLSPPVTIANAEETQNQEMREGAAFPTLPEWEPRQHLIVPVVNWCALNEGLLPSKMKISDVEQRQNQEIRESVICPALPERELPFPTPPLHWFVSEEELPFSPATSTNLEIMQIQGAADETQEQNLGGADEIPSVPNRAQHLATIESVKGIQEFEEGERNSLVLPKAPSLIPTDARYQINKMETVGTRMTTKRGNAMKETLQINDEHAYCRKVSLKNIIIRHKKNAVQLVRIADGNLSYIGGDRANLVSEKLIKNFPLVIKQQPVSAQVPKKATFSDKTLNERPSDVLNFKLHSLDPYDLSGIVAPISTPDPMTKAMRTYAPGLFSSYKTGLPQDPLADPLEINNDADEKAVSNSFESTAGNQDGAGEQDFSNPGGSQVYIPSPEIDRLDVLVRRRLGLPSGPMTYSLRKDGRPPFSYQTMAAMAIEVDPLKSARASDVFDFMQKHFEFYRTITSKWWKQNVRNMLCSSKILRSDRIGRHTYYSFSKELRLPGDPAIYEMLDEPSENSDMSDENDDTSKDVDELNEEGGVFTPQAELQEPPEPEPNPLIPICSYSDDESDCFPIIVNTETYTGDELPPHVEPDDQEEWDTEIKEEPDEGIYCEEPSLDTVSKTLPANDKRVYVCPYCPAVFDTLQDNLDHSVIHPEVMKQCPLCDFSSPDDVQLLWHVHGSHSR